MKFIIDFKNHLTEQEILDHLTAINGTIVKTFGFTEKTYLVECPVEPTFDANMHEHLINDDDHNIQLLFDTVIFDQTWGTTTLAGPTIEISTTDDKDWWKNFVIADPKLDQPSYTIDRKGTGYVVYIMDSGCELSHPEFVGRPISNLFTFNGDFTDKRGHGTALASVVTGNTCGLSDATVKVVRIFDPDQATKQSDMINALDAIYQDFVDNQYANAVLNCSWTINKNTFIESKLQILIDMGFIVIAAAGNNGTPIQDVTPASMNSAITIGSFNNNLVPCDFSNYSDSIISVTNAPTNHGELDGWAPGENIYVAGLNNTYGKVAGTSISTAIQSCVSAYNLTTLSLDQPRDMSHNEWVALSSLQRKDMLDLNDPKYATSKNNISTLFSEIQHSSPNFGTRAKGISGTHFTIGICDPRLYKRLEIYGSLPEGTSVSNTGSFIGKVKIVTQPEITKVPMKIVDNDDNEYEFDYSILVLPNDWNEDSTSDDPEVNLLLQSSSCSAQQCLTPGGCLDDCQIRGCTTMVTKVCQAMDNAFQCYCTL